MKSKITNLVLLNVLALIAWGLAGVAYIACRASLAEGLVSMVVAFGLLIFMLVSAAGALEILAFRSLERFLKAIQMWSEKRNVAGG